MVAKRTNWMAGVLALCVALWVAPASAMAPMQHWVTDKGVRVYFVPAPELPMLDVRVVFDAGSARDGVLPGLSLLTTSLLGQSSGGLDADTIAARFEDVGASFGAGQDRDMAYVSLRTLSADGARTAALDTLALVLSKPDFNAEDFDRERERMRVSLQYQAQKPGEVAKKAFYKAVYGDHPYATPPGGDESSVAALSREAVQGFYKKYFVRGNAVVALVGDLDRAGAEALVDTVTAGLAEGKAAPALPATTVLAEASEQRIAHPSAQTHLLVGQPGVARGDPDYFPLYVGNYVLGGGGFVSRLTTEVRENRGLSYSVYSYFSPLREEGPFIMGLQTRNDQAQQALDLVRKLAAEFVTKGPTAEELDAAKKNITGSFPLNTSSNKKIVGYLAMIGFYGLPLDYLETFSANIEAVTLEQIRDAFQRRVNPDRMATVLVGAPE